jgi:hypothetical protein
LHATSGAIVQVAELPEHSAWFRWTPTEQDAAWHTYVAGRNASAGHAVLTPSQVSATSQVPATVRHTAPERGAGSSKQPSVVSQNLAPHSAVGHSVRSAVPAAQLPLPSQRSPTVQLTPSSQAVEEFEYESWQ